MFKRILSVVIGLIVVAGAIVSVFVIDWKQEVEALPPLVRPLKTMVIESAVAHRIKVYPGRVQASQRVDLAFRVAGPLVDLPVTSGQKVAAGSIIARIDPRDFQIRLDDVSSQIDEAGANLEAMRRGRPEDIEKLRADVRKANAALTLATTEYDRTKAAFDNAAANEFELLQRLEMRERRDAELRHATENLQIGENGARPEEIEAAQAAIRGLDARRTDAQASFDDAKLTAPFAGVVARRYVENFEFVEVRQPIVSLQDISNVDVVINVPESDLVTRNEEETYVAFASFEGIPDRQFELVLKEFATDADSATQTYEVTLTMPAPDGINILPGMTATVRAYPRQVVDGEADAYAVPLDAVPVDGVGIYYVWKLVLEEGGVWAVHRADVEIGNLTGDTAVVTKGLQKGDRIAAAGVRFLREGQHVRLLAPVDEDGS